MATTAQWGAFEWGAAAWGAAELASLPPGITGDLHDTVIDDPFLTVDGSPDAFLSAFIGDAFYVIPVGLTLDARIPVEALTQVARDALLPIEGTAPIEAAPRIPFEAAGVLFLEADVHLPFETLGQVIWRALVPLEVAGHDDTVLAYIWQVLAPADGPQAYRWVVLPELVVGAELEYSWRVLEDPPAQGFTWTVIPAALLELFASQGAGAAVGIAPDTLLPVGRATKD